MEMKMDFLPHHTCTCPGCKKEIKGIKNKDKQECPFCKHEFEIEREIKVVE